MKRSNKDEVIVHYIPEVYNSNINSKTGKEYGWIQCEEFKKPYTSKKWALEALSGSPLWASKNMRRIRIETFKCVDVSYEEVK